MVDKCNWPFNDEESAEFDIHDPDVGLLHVGVVCIFACQTEDGWTALYVGQADDAKEQLDDHPYASMAVQNGATHLHLKGMTSPSGRRRLVHALIEHLQPPINMALREAGLQEY